MKKIIPTALLGVASLTAIGLIGMQAPAVNADEALKRDDDSVELVLVADDDDDDTNGNNDDDTNEDTTATPRRHPQPRDERQHQQPRTAP